MNTATAALYCLGTFSAANPTKADWKQMKQPAAFLYPGYANTQGASPTTIQSDLKAVKGANPPLTGGFLRRYESIAGSGLSTAQFAKAILAGVS